MIVKDSTTKYLKEVLNGLSGVTSINDVSIKNSVIEYFSFVKTSIGRLMLQRLRVEDSAALFEFYFQGLSEDSRDFFPPYPLFSPPVESIEELEERIKDWQKEDDWTVLKLVKDEKIIGIGILKRYKTERPTSGLGVSENYQGKGLGRLIQTVINEQSRLLGLNELYATLAQGNTASLEMHKQCGFVETGKLVPHYIYHNGIKEVDRQDVEMVAKFNDG